MWWKSEETCENVMWKPEICCMQEGWCLDWQQQNQ